ncbi:Glutathione S-transferase [Lentisphaera araneosa HTCC2155]|uniref:Glutathione S-transferase n=2 Tax=Lentisphaera TaxID=256846 RepID=A6DI19_9BACT|nr:Glutathione S-transferase [Lentisphaera araneosa HTCC2155]
MKLLEFPHSHYCEKARWALDFKKIPFQAVAIMPGFHLISVRQYAADTCVPLLINDKQAIQGSSEIIDYLEQQYPTRLLTPLDEKKRQECLALESDMDVRIGESIRQILYSSLLNYPAFIRACFTHGMPRYKKLLFSLTYPFLRIKMKQKYVVSTEKVEQAKITFHEAINDIENRLRKSEYLMDDEFTRADLTVASMLSFLVLPPEHPFPFIEYPAKEARMFCQEYEKHPVSEWVKKMYFKHRSV